MWKCNGERAELESFFARAQGRRAAARPLVGQYSPGRRMVLLQIPEDHASTGEVGEGNGLAVERVCFLRRLRK